MGRKKKKSSKPWCWYCNREFEDEKILLQHQKAKHFKCHICHKKLYTGPGLQIHCMQVHKENIEKVPNSIKGRDNITLEICGMDNIPEEDLIEHEKQKMSQINSNRDETIDSDSQDSDTNVNISQPPLPPLPPPPLPPPIPQVQPPHPPHPPLPPANIPPPGNIQLSHMPPNPLMMQPPPHMMNPMLMSYSHQHQPPPPPQHLMMGMNQMMIHGYHPPHMIPMPAQNNQTPPPLMGQKIQQPMSNQQQVSNKFTPQPLMSSSIQQTMPPALPPPLPQQPPPDNVNTDMSNNSSLIIEEIKKIEAPSGCKIVHPEDDISLEEYRASHHKYKYIPPQYSAPAAVNNIQAAYLNQRNHQTPQLSQGLLSQPPLLPLPTPLQLAHHHHPPPFPPPPAPNGSHQRQPVHYIHPHQQNYQNYHPVNGNRY